MNTKHMVAGAALAMTLSLGGVAQADNHEHDVRLGLKSVFGFGGEAKGKVAGYTGTIRDDLEPTLGFAVNGFYPLHRYLHVGLQTSFGWSISETSSDYDVGRTFVLDISPVLKGRLPLLNDKLELYVLLPIGLSVSVPPDDANTAVGQVDTGVGWNAGLQVGASYLVHEGFGLTFEIGWQGRGTTNGTQINADLTTTSHQFAMNIGMFYGF